jgi:Domain of unknown function (DUF4440)
MKNRIFTIKTILFVSFFSLSKNLSAQTDKELYNKIAHLDSVLFNAYNTQDTTTMKMMFTEDLEWFQDNGGLLSYQTVMSNFQTMIERYKKLNTPIRRDLVEGSLEVHPIKGYGAIHIGKHTFCHWENGKNDCGTFKFLMIWRNDKGVWRISKVVSYDH